MLLQAFKDFTVRETTNVFEKCRNRVVIYGTGRHGATCVRLLTRNPASRKGKVEVALTDSNPARWGASLFGVPVISPNEAAKKYGEDALFIIAINAFSYMDAEAFSSSELYRNLREMGCRNIAWFPDIFYALFMAEAESAQVDISGDLLRLPDGTCIPNFHHAGNSNIRDAFYHEAADLLFPRSLDEDALYVEGPYEYTGAVLGAGEVVIDCGANLGLFAAKAAGKGCNVFAFEPVDMLAPFLLETAALYPAAIHVCKQALGRKPGTAFLGVDPENIGSHSFFKRSSERPEQVVDELQDGVELVAQKVEVTSVDSFVMANGIKRVGFIKADIEGSERDMLAGTVDTLKNHAPHLAICTYHRDDDPEILESIIRDANPNYIIEHKWEKLFAWTAK